MNMNYELHNINICTDNNATDSEISNVQMIVGFLKNRMKNKLYNGQM